MNQLNRQTTFKTFLTSSSLLLLVATHAVAQTPAKALLVLEKDKTQLDIIDPTTLKIVGSVPVGQDPHEVIASADGKIAYVSNYMGQGGPQHKLSVIDLASQKALPAIELGPLQGAHGLDFAGGELYFTAETSKVIGRYDPATQKIDWVMGTGQDRTHMVCVAPSLDRIVTSNVSSATISIIEFVSQPNGGPPPGGPAGRGSGPGGPPPSGRGPSGNQKSWEITNVPVGRGAEGFDVSPDGKEIWTGNAQDNTVSIIDVASKKVVATVQISVGGANRLKFSPDGKLVLVSGLGIGGPGQGPGAGAIRVQSYQYSTQQRVKK